MLDSFSLAVIAGILIVLLDTELRWEHLHISLTGATSFNMAAEFRNDAAEMLHVRKIRYALSSGAQTDTDDTLVGLTKSPLATTMTTNNGNWFQLLVRWEADGTAWVTDAVDTGKNGGDSYGFGQLTLETGESLFVNVLHDETAQNTSGGFTIGYHYED